MAIITVKKNDGTVVALPDPNSFSWSLQDIDADSTGRNQNGDTFRDRVAVKRKWTMTCYVGDRTAPIYTCYTGEPLWENLSTNFIER